MRSQTFPSVPLLYLIMPILLLSISSTIPHEELVSNTAVTVTNTTTPCTQSAPAAGAPATSAVVNTATTASVAIPTTLVIAPTATSKPDEESDDHDEETAAPTPIPTTTAAETKPTDPAGPVATIPSTPSGGGGGGSYEHVGEATFYDPDLGACGTNNAGTEMVAAISQNLFDLTTPNGNPNKNPVCGRKARVSVKGGKEFLVTIVDRCVGCATGDIDLSPMAFDASGALKTEGRVKVEWSLA